MTDPMAQVEFVANGNGTHTATIAGKNACGIAPDGDTWRVTPAKSETRIATALLDTLPKARAYVGTCISAAAKGKAIVQTTEATVSAAAQAKRNAKSQAARDAYVADAVTVSTGKGKGAVTPAPKPTTGAEAKAARVAAGKGNAPKADRAPRVKGTCTIDGCDNPVHAGGLCPKHYNAARQGKARETRLAKKAEADAQAARDAAAQAKADRAAKRQARKGTDATPAPVKQQRKVTPAPKPSTAPVATAKGTRRPRA